MVSTEDITESVPDDVKFVPQEVQMRDSNDLEDLSKLPDPSETVATPAAQEGLRRFTRNHRVKIPRFQLMLSGILISIKVCTGRRED